MPDDKPTATGPALRPETLTAQAGHEADSATGAVVPPLQPSTTYQRRAQDYELAGSAGYSRDHNPTYEPVETLLKTLEGGAAGAVKTLDSPLRKLARAFSGVPTLAVSPAMQSC